MDRILRHENHTEIGKADEDGGGYREQRRQVKPPARQQRQAGGGDSHETAYRSLFSGVEKSCEVAQVAAIQTARLM